MKNYLFAGFWALASLVFACQPATKSSQEKAQTPMANYKLFVGTYTEAETPAGDTSQGIYVYNWNSQSGQLSVWGQSEPVVNPSYLAVHPNGQWVYAVSEVASPHGRVHTFQVDTARKQLTELHAVTSDGAHPCYISLNESASHALVANYTGGNVALLPLSQQGIARKPVSTHQHKGSGPTDRQQAPHAHMITPAPGTPFAFAVDLGTDELRAYKLHPEKDQMQPAAITPTQAGMGPRHLAFHPAKAFAYAIGELDGHIEAYQWNQQTAELMRIQRIATVADTARANQAACADIHVHPNGKWLYGSNRGEINSLIVYAIDEATGRLRLVEEVPAPGRGPRSFAIDPTGRFLLAASQYDHKIGVLAINQETGQLTDTGHEVSLPAPVCLKFHAY